MHNKLLIVDNQFSILGGRNIGDEYFGLYPNYNFLDLDVVLTGDAVPWTSAAFDTYWNADLAYRVSSLAEVNSDSLEESRKQIREFLSANLDLLASYPLRPEDWSEWLMKKQAVMLSGNAVFLQDQPVSRGNEEFRLYEMLEQIVEPGSQELVISSPYLIPVGNFLETLSEDIDAGVKINLITNSLAGNDETASHSHYKKYRKRLLSTGASLYEFHHQPLGNIRQLTDVAPQNNEFVALHAKAAVVDSGRCFIGSLNIDPRAVVLNTENGLYVTSATLCTELRSFLTALLSPENAWKLEQSEKGKLQWTSYEGTTDRQPAQGFGQRTADFFFRLLPIESQL